MSKNIILETVLDTGKSASNTKDRKATESPTISYLLHESDDHHKLPSLTGKETPI